MVLFFVAAFAVVSFGQTKVAHGFQTPAMQAQQRYNATAQQSRQSADGEEEEANTAPQPSKVAVIIRAIPYIASMNVSSYLPSRTASKVRRVQYRISDILRHSPLNTRRY